MYIGTKPTVHAPTSPRARPPPGVQPARSGSEVVPAAIFGLEPDDPVDEHRIVQGDPCFAARLSPRVVGRLDGVGREVAGDREARWNRVNARVDRCAYGIVSAGGVAERDALSWK